MSCVNPVFSRSFVFASGLCGRFPCQTDRACPEQARRARPWPPVPKHHPWYVLSRCACVARRSSAHFDTAHRKALAAPHFAPLPRANRHEQTVGVGGGVEAGWWTVRMCIRLLGPVGAGLYNSLLVCSFVDGYRCLSRGPGTRILCVRMRSTFSRIV